MTYTNYIFQLLQMARKLIEKARFNIVGTR